MRSHLDQRECEQEQPRPDREQPLHGWGAYPVSARAHGPFAARAIGSVVADAGQLDREESRLERVGAVAPGHHDAAVVRCLDRGTAAELARQGDTALADYAA